MALFTIFNILFFLCVAFTLIVIVRYRIKKGHTKANQTTVWKSHLNKTTKSR